MRKVIVGAGNFGREIAGWMHTGEIVFIDDTLPKDAPHRVLGRIEDYEPREGDALVMAISDPRGKKAVASKLLERGAKFRQFIHPSAVIGVGAKIGDGAVIAPFVSVSAGARLGSFVTLNAFSGPGHDTNVGDYATFAAHVNVCGWCRIGTGVYVASSAVVLPRVEVDDWAVVGAGAVVARHVRAGATVYAPFAKVLKAGR